MTKKEKEFEKKIKEGIKNTENFLEHFNHTLEIMEKLAEEAIKGEDLEISEKILDGLFYIEHLRDYILEGRNKLKLELLKITTKKKSKSKNVIYLNDRRK
ncbi:hypothetical protein ACFL1O_00325 [Patescibacteria group bacterium]